MKYLIWVSVVPECLSACVILDFLCIWNTNFQTLQAGKEMAGKIYGQVGMH